VKWGLKDFESRFGRVPESMWIPETAVNLETLEVMADHGIQYVILAPRQAQAVRLLDSDHLWESVRGEKVDTRMPYLIRLPGGQSIAAFFYNGHLSRAVAFEGLLNNGETFANRLCSGFDHSGNGQLMHIATDGESYGHHHLKGDMALAYALEQIEKHDLATLTNYGQHLERFPPTHEARIYDDSSWSCIHGIERWNRDCGCNSGGYPDWNQRWREPLREAMDYLRNRLEAHFEKTMKPYTDRCWDMRDDYIAFILDRSSESRADFFDRWLGKDCGREDMEAALRMLEMQRNLMLMYTSCAWFFDEISGVETVQALAYAARAIELAGENGDEVEKGFLQILQRAVPNVKEFATGRVVYDRLVRGMRMDFPKLAANIAARVAFEGDQNHTAFACFDMEWIHISRAEEKRAHLMVAQGRLTSRITSESKVLDMVVIHMGDDNISIGVRPHAGQESYDELVYAFTRAFADGKCQDCPDMLVRYFDGSSFSLNELFHEQQRYIIDRLFARTLENLDEQFTEIYYKHYASMNKLSQLHIALPQVYFHIAHFVQNKQIQSLLQSDTIEYNEISRYIEEAATWHVELDRQRIENAYVAALWHRLKKCQAAPGDRETWADFKKLVQLSGQFPFALELGEIQNGFASWLQKADLKANISEIADDIAVALKIRRQKGRV